MNKGVVSFIAKPNVSIEGDVTSRIAPFMLNKLPQRQKTASRLDGFFGGSALDNKLAITSTGVRTPTM